MSKRWSVNDDKPSENERHAWRHPNDDQQHVLETTAPGDLIHTPSKITLKPTLSPNKTGVQAGHENWTIDNAPSTSWYILGTIIQEDD